MTDPQIALEILAFAALAAGAFAFLLRDLPYKLGLMGAVLVGVAVGMLMTRRQARIARPGKEEAA